MISNVPSSQGCFESQIRRYIKQSRRCMLWVFTTCRQYMTELDFRLHSTNVYACSCTANFEYIRGNHFFKHRNIEKDEGNRWKGNYKWESKKKIRAVSRWNQIIGPELICSLSSQFQRQTAWKCNMLFTN